MPAGLQAINDGYLLQIDENYRNLHYTQRQDVTCTNLFGQMYYADVTFTNVNIPMVALYTPGKCFVTQIARSGSTVTFRVFAVANGTFAAVMLFDTVQSAGGNVGQQVFDGSGQLIFDSSFGYMKILDVITGVTEPTDFMPNFSRNYPGKTVAIVTGARWSRVMVQYTSVGPNPEWMIFFFSAGVTAWGSGAAGEPVGLSAYGPFDNTSTTDSNQGVYNFLILDVTNLI